MKTIFGLVVDSLEVAELINKKNAVTDNPVSNYKFTLEQQFKTTLFLLQPTNPWVAGLG
jgi:hypothetical protein